MNQFERDEIRELRDFMNRRFMWGAGILVTIALAATGWEMQQTGLIGRTAQVAENAFQMAETNTADIKQIGRDISDSNRQISGMAAQIQAQGRTLDRMDKTLADLARYLREGGP
jgi:predicted negative regulator of RcsB-dependent stress response